jgi:hypothetical protein
MLDPRRELPFAESSARAVRLKRLVAAALLFAAMASLAPLGSRSIADEALLSPEDVNRTVGLENLSVQNDRVAGVIVNRSNNRVRDVKLRFVYSWLWSDEHRQGVDDPSFAVTEVVHDEIPPQGNVTFGYSYPAATVVRGDGRFLVEVRVIGFSTVTESPQPS